MALYNNFKICLELDGMSVPVYPINEGLEFEWKFDPEWKIYEFKLLTSLSFCKEEANIVTAFDESCDRCDGIPISIKTICNGQENEFVSGYLNMNNGNFDKDGLNGCTVDVLPTIENEYTCLFRNWKKKKNILGGELLTKQISRYVGEIECVTSNVPIGGGPIVGPPAGMYQGINIIADNSQLPDAFGWTLTSHAVLVQTTNLTEPLVQAASDALWCREKFTGNAAPPGSNWIQISPTEWVRELVPCQLPYRTTNIDLFGGEKTWRGEFSCELPEVDTTFDNGVKLNDIIPILLEDCPYEICSNFLGISPDGTNPDNAAYDKALSSYQCIMVFQKSDIVNADASNNATKGELYFEKVMEMLRFLNVCFWIEDGKLRIEHISYREAQQQNGIDLTEDPKYARCIRGRNKYGYNSALVPIREEFAWMDDVSPYFNGNPIEYTGNCVDPDQVTEYNSDCLTTDIDYLYNNEEASTSGFVFVSTIEVDGECFINDSNKSLSFTEIIDCLWCHGRPQWSGIINGEEKCFESAKRIKAAPPIEFPLCCEDLTDFDPNQFIKENIGWGEIVSAKYNTVDQHMTVSLLHEQIKCC